MIKCCSNCQFLSVLLNASTTGVTPNCKKNEKKFKVRNKIDYRKDKDLIKPIECKLFEIIADPVI